MVRNCPRCQSEILHETEYDYKAAIRSNRLCESCLDVFCLENDKPVGSLTRRCPRCERKIFYGSFRSRALAVEGAHLCKPCADDDTRAKCRDEVWRARHAEALKGAWADPGSVFNSEKYRQKLSEAQLTMSPEVIAKRGEGNRRCWASYTDEERVARVANLVAHTQTPEAIAKRSESMTAWWETIPADHPYRNWTVAQRARMSEILKTNPSTLEALRHAVERSHRSGRASKLESEVAQVLIPLGFKQTQPVLGTSFYADFLNEETRQIVELYGDFWHCHPRFESYWNLRYDGVNPTTREAPAVRRAIDAERVRLIEAQGYSVEIVWQYDLKRWLKKFK